MFGIEDGTHAVLGTSFDPQAEEGQGNQLLPLWLAVLWGQLNDRHKVSANLLRDDDVRTVEDDKGRQFVVVNVPRASRLQRPVFAGPNPMTRTCRHQPGGSAVAAGFAPKT